MLASNPIESDTTFRSLSLQPVGDHSHVQRADEGGMGDAVTLLGAAALLVVGYVIGGVATSGTAGSTGEAPLPVDIGGGAAKVRPATIVPATFAPASPVVGEFRLGPGNDPAPGVVRVTIPAPAAGEFRLAPGNQQPIGVAVR